MGKEMEKEKNIISKKNYNLMENIWMGKDGMEKEKSIISMENYNLKENI